MPRRKREPGEPPAPKPPPSKKKQLRELLPPPVIPAPLTTGGRNSGSAPVFSDEDVIEALIWAKGNESRAAKRLGCSDSMIRARIRTSEAVRECDESFRQEMIDIAEDKLRAALDNDETWAVAKVLDTLGKSRGYFPKTEKRQGGTEDGIPITVVQDSGTGKKLVDIINAMPLEQRREILAQMGVSTPPPVALPPKRVEAEVVEEESDA